jgi:hypothetical protein
MESEDEEDELFREKEEVASTSSRCLSSQAPPDDDDDDDWLWVDWGALGNGPWGRVPLTHGLLSSPQDLLGDLVGWATHLEGTTHSESALSKNPLVGLPSMPMRPSLLGFIQDEIIKILVETNEQELWECFDTSALVAMGVIFEEMLTATFLPLASWHVNRCRSLEGDDAFQEWTLPPAEAIMKLSECMPDNDTLTYFLGGLPTSRQVSRTLYDTRPLPLKRAKQWCRLHGSSLEAAQSTWHIHRLFLPQAYERLGQVEKSRTGPRKRRQAGDSDNSQRIDCLSKADPGTPSRVPETEVSTTDADGDISAMKRRKRDTSDNEDEISI